MHHDAESSGDGHSKEQKLLLSNLHCFVACLQPVRATVGKLWFDIYRKPATVRSVLQLVYGRTCAIDDEVGDAWQ